MLCLSLQVQKILRILRTMYAWYSEKILSRTPNVFDPELFFDSVDFLILIDFLPRAEKPLVSDIVIAFSSVRDSDWYPCVV